MFEIHFVEAIGTTLYVYILIDKMEDIQFELEDRIQIDFSGYAAQYVLWQKKGGLIEISGNNEHIITTIQARCLNYGDSDFIGTFIVKNTVTEKRNL